MSHSLLYATVESRLHADLAVVRLKQAGISTDRISVLYGHAARPNSAVCWLDGTSTVPLSAGGTAAVAGLLCHSLTSTGGHAQTLLLVDRLLRLGVTRDQGLNIEESLLENRIVVAVEVDEAVDLPIILSTFRELDAEKIHIADLNGKTREAAHGSIRIPARAA